jgi:hypothetical protein
MLFGVAVLAGVAAPVLAILAADVPALAVALLGLGPVATLVVGAALRRPRGSAAAVALTLTLIAGLVVLGAASSGLHDGLDP